MTLPITSGYIVTSNEGIWGIGDTADAAWSDFLREMADANTTVREDGDEIDVDRAWCRARDFKIRPATQALIAAATDQGGAIAWGIVSGVACTVEEEDGANDR